MVAAETPFARTKKRLSAMQAERQSFEPQVREISDNFAPGRVRYNSSEANQGRKRHGQIINNRPLLAARTAASGLHAGLTSPARPWARLLTPDRDMAEFGPIKQWLGIAEGRMRQIWAKSNLYTALPYLYGEVLNFATMASLALESDQTVIRFEPYSFGQYWIACDAYGVVDTFYKLVPMTVRQVVGKFGLKACSLELRNKYERGAYEEKVDVLCAIEPNAEAKPDARMARDMAFQSVYWEMKAGENTEPLLRSGFAENPILSTRWETTAGDTYGTSCPGMIALGAARALQVNERNKAQAIQLAYKPPLQGPASMERAGISLLPGAYNSVPESAIAGSGIRSLYDFKPDIQGLLLDIQGNERDIDQAYFVDLFLMLQSDARSTPPTAEEIRARYEEKVLALGPTLERFNSDLLGPLVDRTFAIMVRQSQPYWQGLLGGEPMLPPPPPDLQDVPLDVDFISTLQQAQRAASLGNIERFAMFTGQLAVTNPSAMDKFDADQALDEYGTGLAVPAGIVRDDDTVLQIRAARAKEAQQQKMLAMAPAIKDIGSAVKDVAGTQPAPNNLLAGLSQAAAANSGVGALPV
jgi:hypothetical protein